MAKMAHALLVSFVSAAFLLAQTLAFTGDDYRAAIRVFSSAPELAVGGAL
jgi:hypothetical protein